MAPVCPPWRRASLPPSPGLAPLCPAGREGSAVPPLSRSVPVGPAVLRCSPCPPSAPGPGVPGELPLCSLRAPRTGLPQVGWVIGALFRRTQLLPLPPSLRCPSHGGSGQGPAGPPGSCQRCSLSHGLTTLLQTPPWAWLPPARPAPLPRSVWARREGGREEGVTGQDEACTESSCR